MDSAIIGKFFSNFEGESPVLQFIGKWGYKIYEGREEIQMYIHLILSALFPIYIGAHASLRRPPSAAKPPKSKKAENEDDDEIKVEPTVEGLTPSDAILFPILAGVTLTGLYYLIKWIQDPKLLNKILNYYFSLIGIFGVGKLAGDSLNVATTFIFPSVWSSRGKTYFVDPLLSQQVTGKAKAARTEVHREFTDKTNPFPGYLSSVKFPESINKRAWALRALLKNHWIFRGYLHGVFSAKFHIQMNDIMGFFIGIATIIAYNASGKAWWLMNLIGFGFCYGTLQLMSPTTFWTGSLVLAGLFVYDIVMVFYT
jgi:minor histocompatibility antigen H13